jgi:hypothetical protein
MFFIPLAEARDKEILSAPAANNTNRSEYAKCFLMMSETPLRGMDLNRKIKPAKREKQRDGCGEQSKTARHVNTVTPLMTVGMPKPDSLFVPLVGIKL